MFQIRASQARKLDSGMNRRAFVRQTRIRTEQHDGRVRVTKERLWNQILGEARLGSCLLIEGGDRGGVLSQHVRRVWRKSAPWIEHCTKGYVCTHHTYEARTRRRGDQSGGRIADCCLKCPFLLKNTPYIECCAA